MYILVGVVAGILAGLLGIGGGLVIVPMLVFCFVRQGIPDAVIMHLALGTSLASIMFTAVSSFRAHHKRGAVHWEVVRKIVIGIFTGTFIGTCIAAQLSTRFLKGFFVVFLYYVAIQMLTNKKPKPSRHIPGRTAMFGVGNIHRRRFQPGGHRWRKPFRAIHDLVQHARAPCHRHLSSHRLSHRHRRHHRLYRYNGWSIQNLPEFTIGICLSTSACWASS
jgi:uncharacterized membrane protein YfcA